MFAVIDKVDNMRTMELRFTDEFGETIQFDEDFHLGLIIMPLIGIAGDYA